MSIDPKNLPGGWYDPAGDDLDGSDWWQMDRYDDEDDLDEWDDVELDGEIRAFGATEEDT